MKGGILLTVMAGALLCACSLEDEGSLEAIDTSHHMTEQRFERGSLEEKFVISAQKCIAGDLSELEQLIADYKASFADRTSVNSQIYQQTAVNRYFENCAFKAMQLKDQRAFDAMLRRPGMCALTARKFYEQDRPADAAYWLQRVINLQGQAQGYTTAGLTFIRHPKTLRIGARLLQEGARLGNRQARDTLLSLTRPSSSEYQEVMSALREDYFRKVKSGEIQPIVPVKRDKSDTQEPKAPAPAINDEY